MAQTEFTNPIPLDPGNEHSQFTDILTKFINACNAPASKDENWKVVRQWLINQLDNYVQAYCRVFLGQDLPLGYSIMGGRKKDLTLMENIQGKVFEVWSKALDRQVAPKL